MQCILVGPPARKDNSSSLQQRVYELKYNNERDFFYIKVSLGNNFWSIFLSVLNKGKNKYKLHTHTHTPTMCAQNHNTGTV